jgi:hypothetical protein
MYSLGLFAPDWETVHYPKEMKAVGNFTAAAFDPLAWKANYPNARASFRQVLPLEGFRIVDGRLTRDDLAVQYGFSSPSRYHLSWFVWHNEVQTKEDASTSEDTVLPDTFKSLTAGSYIGCRIALENADKRSVTIYFRHEGDTWKLVGISRTTV